MTEAVRRLAADNPATARQLRDAFSATAQLIDARPEIGRRQLPIVGDQYRIRSLRHSPDIVSYKPLPKPPRIIRALRTARDLPPLLADLLDEQPPP